jgi:hypothetical protein
MFSCQVQSLPQITWLQRFPQMMARTVPAAAVVSGVALVLSLSLFSPSAGAQTTYLDFGNQAVQTLEREYYNGDGTWHLCLPHICGTSDIDWGADSLTYALYLHWLLTNGPSVPPIMNALAAKAHLYGATESTFSDMPLWDSVANAREYQVTGSSVALQKAKAAFTVVDGQPARYALGACPSINYQQPGGGSNHLKTLETDSNYVKAALLLYRLTSDSSYKNKAEAKYNAIRNNFLDTSVPLYTVYVFDDGSTCTQKTRRFYGSVNGNMIWNGYHLAKVTGNNAYHDQAIATAIAIQQLSDNAGIYENLQAENDVVEPLIEAMTDLATSDNQAFAWNWLIGNANASQADINSNKAYGRFFGGPGPRSTVTAWQANGGIALQFAAAALNPNGVPANPAYWTGAGFVTHDLKVTNTPAQFTFSGRSIAIVGTIGEQCCETGHIKLFIDGTETFDTTGVWQNKSSSGLSIPNSILFAWRWAAPGTHTIQIHPGIFNGKEGGSFFHMTGYYIVP